MKQETLEEAAEKYAESNQYDLVYYDEGGYQGIEIKSFTEKLVDFTAKWQQERMYSEEDLKNAFFSGCQSERQIKPRIKSWEEWFEKFKKK